MMRALTVLAAALALVAQAAGAQSPALFDSHVHLWKGEDSLQAYEKQLKEGQLQVAGVGTMWFGVRTKRSLDSSSRSGLVTMASSREQPSTPR